MNRKTDLLKQVQLFSSLGSDELGVIARYSEYLYFAPGTLIFDEGDSSRSLYIIDSGEVLITRKGDDGIDNDIAHYVKGECIGEMSLFSNDRRTARAISVNGCRLLAFPADPHDIRMIAEKHSEIFASILYKCIAIIAGRIRSTNRLITEKTPWIHDLRRKLYTDKLTGLLNRNYLYEELKDNIFQMGMPLSCIMIKPDRFKYVNDTHGHEAGDKVLRLIAVFLQSALGNGEMAIRYRGDEFGVLVQNQDRKGVLEHAEGINSTLKGLDLSSVFRDDQFSLTFSIGIAFFSDDYSHSESFVEKAHSLMMEAWKNGGNSIVMENISL
jgi:diguanylate cyclase (GGDEF)-like protein